MKRMIVGIVIVLLILSVGYCEEEPLQFTIRLDKKIYGFEEHIEGIECEFRNVGKQDIVFCSYSCPDYIIKNSKDMTIPREAGNQLLSIRDILKEDFIILKTGEPYRRIGGIPTTKDSVYYYKLKPDIYSIQAVHNNLFTGENFGLSAWTGTLTSNIITIEVVEKK